MCDELSSTPAGLSDILMSFGQSDIDVNALSTLDHEHDDDKSLAYQVTAPDKLLLAPVCEVGSGDIFIPVPSLADNVFIPAPSFSADYSLDTDSHHEYSSDNKYSSDNNSMFIMVAQSDSLFNSEKSSEHVNTSEFDVCDQLESSVLTTRASETQNNDGQELVCFAEPKNTELTMGFTDNQHSNGQELLCFADSTNTVLITGFIKDNSEELLCLTEPVNSMLTVGCEDDSLELLHLARLMNTSLATGCTDMKCVQEEDLTLPKSSDSEMVTQLEDCDDILLVFDNDKRDNIEQKVSCIDFPDPFLLPPARPLLGDNVTQDWVVPPLIPHGDNCSIGVKLQNESVDVVLPASDVIVSPVGLPVSDIVVSHVGVPVSDVVVSTVSIPESGVIVSPVSIPVSNEHDDFMADWTSKLENKSSQVVVVGNLYMLSFVITSYYYLHAFYSITHDILWRTNSIIEFISNAAM